VLSAGGVNVERRVVTAMLPHLRPLSPQAGRGENLGQ
jgi:hypothetical protein